MRKAKKQTFSAVQAVKANARERVGPVPPERVLPDPKQRAESRKTKHKETLSDLLEQVGGATMNARTCLVLIAAAVAIPVPAQQIQVNKDNKTIAITTSGQADTLADTAVVTVGFHLFGKDQEATYGEATRTSNAIISALRAAGLRKEAIESEDQSLSPLDPKSEIDSGRFNQGMRFEFSQSWHVTVPADAAAGVLHVAITSGANDSGGIEWHLKDDDALEADAAKKALEHANQIAATMAAGLNAKLGALVYASNQTPPRGLAALLGGATLETSQASIGPVKKNLAPLAISPEKITRTATVYAVFAIQ